jgi:hypothetical protein
MNGIRKAGRILFWGAIIWASLAAVVIVEIWPRIPQSRAGWVALVAFGPPLYVLLEAAGQAAWGSRVGQRICNHPSSVVRVLLGVTVVVCFFVGMWAVLWLFARA